MANKRRFYTNIPDPTTFIGVIVFVVLLLKVIGIENGLKFFYDRNSILIVGGGTLGASLVHFPVTQLIKMFGRLKVIFFTRKPRLSMVIDQIVEISQTVKSEGKMELVKKMENIPDPFLSMEYS